MKRGEVWDAVLDPSKGSEQQGKRPVVIVSPDTMNEALDTKVVVPLTSKFRDWSSRVATEFDRMKGQAMCEQIRSISSSQLVQRLGRFSDVEVVEIMSTIGALYATP